MDGMMLLDIINGPALLAILVGTFIGMLIGALPGLGASIAIVLLLPFSYSLDPLVAILLLLAAYQGAEYGGSISSIVLGIPGTGGAVVTMLDGRPYALNHGPGRALGYSLYASTIGGLIGGFALIFLTFPLMKFALKLSEPEFFLLGSLALIAVGSLSTGNGIKGLIFAALGLLAGTVGMDTFTGILRFNFNRPELMEGIDIIALIIALFAIPEILNMINKGVTTQYTTDLSKVGIKLPIREFRSTIKSTVTGSIIGTIIGIFPGLAAGSATWFSYLITRKMSKSPKTFGKGNPEGIMAPEASNNAAVGGALIPMLALNIPGTPAIAIVVGALLIHGIQPGPSMMARTPELVYGIFYGYVLTCVAMFLLGLLVTNLFARILTVRIYYLIPFLIILSLLGVYASHNLSFHIWFAFLAGVAFFVLSKLDYSLPCFILGFVLCPIIEESLRRTLILSQGSYLIFFERIYSVIILLFILLIVIYAVYQKITANKSGTNQSIST